MSHKRRRVEEGEEQDSDKENRPPRLKKQKVPVNEKKVTIIEDGSDVFHLRDSSSYRIRCVTCVHMHELEYTIWYAEYPYSHSKTRRLLRTTKLLRDLVHIVTGYLVEIAVSRIRQYNPRTRLT